MIVQNEMEFLIKFLDYLERRLSEIMKTVDTGYVSFVLFENNAWAYDVIFPPSARHPYAAEAIEILKQIIKTKMLIIKRRHCEK